MSPCAQEGYEVVRDDVLREGGPGGVTLDYV